MYLCLEPFESWLSDIMRYYSKYFSLLQNADILQLHHYLIITYNQVQHGSLKASNAQSLVF